MKRFFLFTFILLSIFDLRAQQEIPKHEFRAVWVATVANIDWPSKPGLSSKAQQNEIRTILDLHQKLGMNTIILQVRPASDALYKSNLEPWSKYLTGTPGKAPDPFYDPLEFWIKECHSRGMELHAWLNPYRVALNSTDALAGNHIAFIHPEWILEYGNKLYFDPGIPEARDFVNEVVKDIVARYDVDAIHFDDYFYPYPLQEDFPDSTSYNLYNKDFENKADWRRNNVDTVIKTINETIKKTKPWVKFGISPFGVWRNSSDDPLGSDTKAGTTNYDHLYADVIKWQKEGWMDYLLPQIYWQIGHPAVDFELLSNWWAQHAYDRAMYIGHAVYKSDAKSATKEWTEAGELPTQVKLLRTIPKIQGSAFYSSKHFKRDLMGFQDSLQQILYKSPAIIPSMNWIDGTPPQPVKKIKKSGRKVKWKIHETTNEMDKAKQFIVYLNEVGAPFNQKTSANIYTISRTKEIEFEKINKKKKKYEVRVAVLDRTNNESNVSKPVVIKL